MNFKYELPRNWVEVVSNMPEFANGATQVTIRLKNGVEVPAVLVSASKYLIAARGYKDLPFRLEEIAEIFQTADDASPALRGDWEYWDNWDKPNE